MINKMLPAVMVLTLSAGGAAHAAAPVQEADTPAPASLTVADAIAPVVLPAGVTSTLQLESNPGTGYSWQVVETLNLKIDEPFDVAANPATPAGMVGAPGTATIKITPRSKGPATLKLVYTQPWRDRTTEDPTLYFVFDVQ